MSLMSVGWCVDAEPAPMGPTVVLKLSRYFSVLHLHHVVLSGSVNTTENLASMDAGSNTLQLVQEVLFEIKALENLQGSEINLSELLSVSSKIYLIYHSSYICIYNTPVCNSENEFVLL